MSSSFATHTAGHETRTLIRQVEESVRPLRDALNLKQETIEASPEYDPDRPLGREYEVRLHEHYGRPGYWAEIER